MCRDRTHVFLQRARRIVKPTIHAAILHPIVLHLNKQDQPGSRSAAQRGLLRRPCTPDCRLPGSTLPDSDRLTNTCARLVELPDNAKGSDDKGKIVNAPCDHRNDAVASCHSGARGEIGIPPSNPAQIWSVGDRGLNASVRKRTEFGAAAGVENDRNCRGRGLGRDRCGDCRSPSDQTRAGPAVLSLGKEGRRN